MLKGLTPWTEHRQLISKRLAMTTKRYCFYCGGHLYPIKDASGKAKQGHYICSVCGAKFYDNPIPAVAALVLDRKNLLLTRRAVPPFKGSWCLPGGFMESGEDTLQALTRELHEETGLIGKSFQLIDVASFTDSSHQSKGVIIIGYHVSVYEGNLRPGDDALDAKFFRVENLPSIPFSTHRFLIERLHQLMSANRL